MLKRQLPGWLKNVRSLDVNPGFSKADFDCTYSSRLDIIVSLEIRNKPHATIDFSLVLYIKRNVGLSALYSAPHAPYSALSPTLCLTYRTRKKSIVACGLIQAFK